MSDTKFLKRLIKKKNIYIYNELKNILTFFKKISQTQYPAAPNTQQHHNMKLNLNTEFLAKKIPIPSTSMH